MTFPNPFMVCWTMLIVVLMMGVDSHDITLDTAENIFFLAVLANVVYDKFLRAQTWKQAFLGDDGWPGFLRGMTIVTAVPALIYGLFGLYHTLPGAHTWKALVADEGEFEVIFYGVGIALTLGLYWLAEGFITVIEWAAARNAVH